MISTTVKPLSAPTSAQPRTMTRDIREVTDPCAYCESEPVVDAVYTAVVGSACSCVLEAGSDRVDRSSSVCYESDTR